MIFVAVRAMNLQSGRAQVQLPPLPLAGFCFSVFPTSNPCPPWQNSPDSSPVNV